MWDEVYQDCKYAHERFVDQMLVDKLREVTELAFQVHHVNWVVVLETERQQCIENWIANFRTSATLAACHRLYAVTQFVSKKIVADIEKFLHEEGFQVESIPCTDWDQELNISWRKEEK